MVLGRLRDLVEDRPDHVLEKGFQIHGHQDNLNPQSALKLVKVEFRDFEEPVDELKLCCKLVEALLCFLKLSFPAVLLRERSDRLSPLRSLWREIDDGKIPINRLLSGLGHVTSFHPVLNRL